MALAIHVGFHGHHGHESPWLWLIILGSAAVAYLWIRARNRR